MAGMIQHGKSELRADIAVERRHEGQFLSLLNHSQERICEAEEIISRSDQPWDHFRDRLIIQLNESYL